MDKSTAFPRIIQVIVLSVLCVGSWTLGRSQPVPLGDRLDAVEDRLYILPRPGSPPESDYFLALYIAARMTEDEPGNPDGYSRANYYCSIMGCPGLAKQFLLVAKRRGVKVYGVSF